MAHFLSR
jgi:hypothetical protein